MYVLIIPYSILSLPVIIIDLFVKDTMNYDSDTKWLRPFIGFMIYGALFILFCMVFFAINVWTADKAFFEKYNPIMMGGVIAWIVTIIGLVVWAGSSISQAIKERKQRKQWEREDAGETIPEKSDSMIIAFIKATYKKYCPKIDWTE
jgi:uncharacterized integral membrane protein